MPLFGLSTQLRVFVDPDLLQYDSVNDFVWAAAGTWNDNFGAAPADVLCGWWCCHRPETRLITYRLILRRLVSTSPVAVKRSPITTTIDELSPVSGRDSAFFTFVMLGTVVAVAAMVVVGCGGLGCPGDSVGAGHHSVAGAVVCDGDEFLLSGGSAPSDRSPFVIDCGGS